MGYHKYQARYAEGTNSSGPSSSPLLSSLVILTPVAQGLTFPKIARKNTDKLLASTG